MAEGIGLPSFLDWIILAVGLLSIVIGAARGFLREALSLVIWVAALIMATLFADDVSRSIARWISSESLRYPLAFAAVFLVVLLLGAVLQKTLAKLVEVTGLGGLDRVLGMLFGMARALLLLVVIVAVLEPMFETEPWWQRSLFLPHLLALQETVMGVLRDAVAAVGDAMNR